jgi:hypothetical protein
MTENQEKSPEKWWQEICQVAFLWDQAGFQVTFYLHRRDVNGLAACEIGIYDKTDRQLDYWANITDATSSGSAILQAINEYREHAEYHLSRMMLRHGIDDFQRTFRLKMFLYLNSVIPPHVFSNSDDDPNVIFHSIIPYLSD